MTEGIFDTVKDWTGDRPATCPWWALSDPLVKRVLDAYGWWEDGHLEFALPFASHRLVEGLGHYHMAKGLITSQQMQQDDEEREKKRKRSGASSGR